MRHASWFAFALMASAHATGAAACGYHSALASSAFNIVHPKSLGVAAAVRRASDQGILKASTPTLPTFTGGEYRRATDQLQQLEERLAQIAPRLDNGESLQFAFVFVGSHLWSQYTVGFEGATVAVHTPPARAGETIVLSDERVLGAVLDRQLELDTAVEMGLLQFSDDPNGGVFQLFEAAFG